MCILYIYIINITVYCFNKIPKFVINICCLTLVFNLH
nr:MAG TPA: hypothetical protein [Caudoviricetes sp.]